MKPIIRNIALAITGGLIIAIVALGVMSLESKPAQALGGCWCVLDWCQEWNGDQTRDLISDEHDDLRELITEQFQLHQLWIVEEFIPRYIVPPLVVMTEQLVTTGMHQMFIVGALMDAKIQLETQRLYQEKTAQAHKKYHPSTGMCTIGTATQSLAATDVQLNYAKYVQSQSSLDRQLGLRGSSAARGPSDDIRERIDQFKRYYCDPSDTNRTMQQFCSATIPTSVNKDIDFTRTIGLPRTLDVNYTNLGLNSDERDVKALAKNLFGHEVFSRPTESELNENDILDEFMDMRAVIAKRSVAENSFHSVLALKASSSPEASVTAEFLGNIMEQLGVEEDEEIDAVLGQSPSYFAQMEILAQKIYQTPVFFTDLYDKPANVMRKDVAMQAINLMLERDTYKSELRTEALLSLLLEMEVADLQKQVQERISKIDTGGRED